MNPPMKESMDSQEQRPRSKWSHSYRPLPFDGGYLPVHAVLKAVLNTHYRGWLSIEVFDINERLEETGMELYAKRARESLENLLLFS